MATPVFDCLRDNFPQARMACVVRSYARGVIQDGPWFETCISANDKTWKDFWALARQMRTCKPDLTILLPNSWRSLLSARLAGSGLVYGYRRNGRGLFLSGGPRPQRSQGKITPQPMTAYYLEICRHLGLHVPPNLRPRLFIGEQTREKASALLQRYGIAPGDLVIGLNPGARFGSSKCWPAAHFAKLADLLNQRFQAHIMLFCGPGEESIAHAIVSRTRAPIIDTGPDHVDLDLLKPLIQRCGLLVTNDTGPRHYAVAFDVPVVVIMGPTHGAYTAQYLEKTVVLQKTLPCLPCHKKQCPTDHRCMTDITPEQVLEQCSLLWSKEYTQVKS